MSVLGLTGKPTILGLKIEKERERERERERDMQEMDRSSEFGRNERRNEGKDRRGRRTGKGGREE